MAGHTVIIGYGATGRSAAHALSAAEPGSPLVVLDTDVTRTALAAHDGADPVLGDGRSVVALGQAGVPTAATVIVAVADDATAVRITETVRQLNNGAAIATLIRQPRSRELAVHAGADHVVVSADLTGRLMGMAIRQPELPARVLQALQQSPELTLTERAVRAAETGRDPAASDPLVLAVLRDGARLWRDQPEVGTLRADDRLLVLRMTR